MTLSRRVRAAVATAVLTAAAVPLVNPVAAAAAAPGECNVNRGGTVSEFWPQTRLKFTRAWPITTGRNVVVGVVDSGLNVADNPQLARIDVRRGSNVIGPGFSASDTRDCYGHGTAVTSIIAAPPVADTDFVGIAPGVTIVPIKQTNTQEDKTGTSQGIGRGIDAALAANATVINVSIATPSPTPELETAVRRAAAKDVVIVAAAGNEGQGQNLPAYPAAYSTRYANVIGVSASDTADGIAAFSDSGRYVTLAAPGVKVPAAAGKTGYTIVAGTSFAAPYVTGTVALLRSEYPSMNAAAIRARLIATADPPPASVPDRRYGYGIVNPYLAVTSVRQDGPPPTAAPAAALPAPTPPVAQAHTLEDTAIAVSLGLFGVALLVIVAAVVTRGRHRRRIPELV